MGFDYDVIVIGSGFGGSVISCRLAEKGKKVCLLERGKEYGLHSFPRRIHEVKNHLFWDPEDKKYGYMEIRDNPESDLMSVTSAGLGGGSLIYANVLIPMPSEYFKWWPKPYTRELLEPFYKKVLETMEATPYPYGKDPYYTDTPKTKYFKEAGERIEKAHDDLEKPNVFFPHLAVRFKGDFPGHQQKNIHGSLQSKCNKCGECDIGCNSGAKNTLDHNYIFRARNLSNNPIDIKTQADVQKIEPYQEGYKIEYLNLAESGRKVQMTAGKVFICAGSLGSTRLLLKQKRMGTLPCLSEALGTRWSGNGDLLGFGLNCEKDLDPTNGPVITTAINFKFDSYPDGYPSALYLEDAGAPVGLAWYLAGKQLSPDSFWQSLKLGGRFIINRFKTIFGLQSPGEEINIGDKFAHAIDSDKNLRQLMILLGMGKDRSTGKLELREDDELLLKWDIRPSQIHFDRTRERMKSVVKELGGIFLDNPLTEVDKIVAVHPLGGCPMGPSKEEGVVDPLGRVYEYNNLYVVDGSIFPTSVGPNPALTIAAVAEYIADQVV
ncbi:MAG: GMC family oxidoreductase [Bdellovibrionales bacterium]|nr:GMC family oxidoreductase [Bdellovibrionales bacterium]